jgi:hypothetical protein
MKSLATQRFFKRTIPNNFARRHGKREILDFLCASGHCAGHWPQYVLLVPHVLVLLVFTHISWGYSGGFPYLHE